MGPEACAGGEGKTWETLARRRLKEKQSQREVSSLLCGKAESGFVGLGVGGRCGRRECGQKKKSGQEQGLEEKGREAGKSLRCAPGFEGALI